MSTELRIAGTVNDSIVDGPGIRLTIFVQGCPHNCEGCHNPQTHDLSGGEVVGIDSLLEKVKGNPLLDGVTFSGGEPFCQASALAELGRQIKELGLNVITYTGYEFETLYASRDKNGWGELLGVTDILIDGKFILAQRSLDVKFRGSTNQRCLDCQSSLREGRAVEADI